jgi:restriction endonuclease-like protein
MTNSPDDNAFKIAARHDAMKWKATTDTLSDYARGSGQYRNHDALPFCLPRDFHEFNLLPEARAIALQRFSAAGIPWHDGVDDGPSNHLLDSQVQCANALAPFVNDPDALAAIFGHVLPIDEVLPFAAEGGAAHVSPFDATDSVVFEWQGLENHLNEWVGTPTRGSRATSADAAIRYRSTDGSIELALIEWKYTESYPTGRLATSSTSTATRLSRYRALFDLPEGPLRGDLIRLEDLLGEPVYQLMRLSLLARCIGTNHEQGVDRARLVYVAPRANRALWASPGTSAFASHAAGRPLDVAWTSLLRDSDDVAFLDSAHLLDEDSPVSDEFRSRYATLAAN